MEVSIPGCVEFLFNGHDKLPAKGLHARRGKRTSSLRATLCERAATGNETITARRSTGPRLTQVSERAGDPVVGGFAVTIRSGNPDDRRTSQSRSGQVTKCVVVRTLTLPTALTEADRSLRGAIAVRLLSPLATQVPVVRDVKAQRRIVRIEVQRGESKSREVLRLVNLDQRPRTSVTKVARQWSHPFCCLCTDPPTQSVKDRFQNAANLVGFLWQPEVATLVQPRFPSPVQRDAIGRRCLSKRSFTIPDRHQRTLVTD